MIFDIQDRADQYQADCEKQAAARAATLESLLLAGDYEAIRDWIDEWECDDSSPDSLSKKYRQLLNSLREQRSVIQTTALPHPTTYHNR